jgi:hypothetical protein
VKTTLNTIETLFRDPAELPQASIIDHPSEHTVEAYCSNCCHGVDAVCPECNRQVESHGSGEVFPFEAASEFHRRVLHYLYSKRNSKFAIACFLIATGSPDADGVSMTEFAKSFGVTKAAVSKYCREICRSFNIPPSRYMQTEESANKAKIGNWRPTKKPSTYHAKLDYEGAGY